MDQKQIKRTCYNATHGGMQPIRVLSHNIMHQFENTNPIFLQLTLETIAKKGLKRGIGYYSNDKAITEKVDGHYQMPFVNIDKKIYLHESFASYLWCLSYALVVLYDEAVAKPSQNIYIGKQVNNIDLLLIETAQRIFDYGMSLIEHYSEWDKKKLINPEFFSPEEEFWVFRANGIYKYAMNFILCHEFAHVELGHMDALLAGKSSDTEILQYEIEADKRAFELMKLGWTAETTKTSNLGVLIGLCSLLYFRKHTMGIDHPDTDDRIHSFLTFIDPANTDPIWGIAALSYRLWDHQFSKCLNYLTAIKDFREMYLDIKKQVEQEK